MIFNITHHILCKKKEIQTFHVTSHRRLDDVSTEEKTELTLQMKETDPADKLNFNDSV